MRQDALGRMLTEVAPQGTVTSEYDLAGRRTKVTLPGATSLFANYDYDLLGNVTFVRENGAVSGVGVLATYQYDSLSRRSSVTFGNGVVQGYAYDNASRLATQTNDLASTANDLTQTFSYSPASQITSVTRSNDLYAWTGHSNGSLSSTPNGLNQIGNVGAATVTHDSKGNITGVGSDTYGYTSENFLTSGPGSATLAYDSMGRLYQVAQGATTTRMGYDGLSRIAEYDGSNAIQRRYIHGPGVDDPIVAYEGTGTASRSFLSSDERGSVITLTGASTTLNKYDEFGVPQAGNSGKFGYTGQAWVPEIGLWYYKARFYRPDIGRFMQTDPIGYEGDAPNLYIYVLNDPVNWVDSLGLIRICQYWTIEVDGGEPVRGSRCKDFNLPTVGSISGPRERGGGGGGDGPDSEQVGEVIIVSAERPDRRQCLEAAGSAFIEGFIDPLSITAGALGLGTEVYETRNRIHPSDYGEKKYRDTFRRDIPQSIRLGAKRFFPAYTYASLAVGTLNVAVSVVKNPNCRIRL